jgi:trimethylamine--corrinoid protein Co-methyltransferase
VAGAVALGHAETLAVLVVHQLASPGAPFVYGVGAGSAFDMRPFIDVWLSPEGLLGGAAASELAGGLLGLPTWDYAGCGDAKAVDTQLAAEMAVTILYAAQTGASMYHDVGEFEAGTQNSIESLILGDTLIGLARRLTAGIEVDDETLRLAEIEEAGPGGSFLALPSTRAHHRDVWRSPLFDTGSHDQWLAAGRPTLEDRLHEAVLDLAARAEAVVDDDVADRLDGCWQRL